MKKMPSGLRLSPRFVIAPVLSFVLSANVFAAKDHTDKEIKQDITRHRAIAAAHENAAKCFESGKKEDVCHKELQAACKGLAIGKFCGLKHEH